jgi:hypothetical protein
MMQMGDALIWHRQFKHCSGKKIRVLNGMNPELPRDISFTFDCKYCSKANMRQKELRSMRESYHTMDTCSADICGLLQVFYVGRVIGFFGYG